MPAEQVRPSPSGDSIRRWIPVPSAQRGGNHEFKNPGLYVRRLPRCGVRYGECKGLSQGRCRRCCRRTRRRAPCASGRCRGLRDRPPHGQQATCNASACDAAGLAHTRADSAFAAALKQAVRPRLPSPARWSRMARREGVPLATWWLHGGPKQRGPTHRLALFYLWCR